MSETPGDYAPERRDMRKSREIIQISFTEAEAREAKRLLLVELQQRGCAADPAATSALFKLVHAIWCSEHDHPPVKRFRYRRPKLPGPPCGRCGRPRHVGSGELCWACYRTRAAERRLEREAQRALKSRTAGA